MRRLDLAASGGVLMAHGSIEAEEGSMREQSILIRDLLVVVFISMMEQP